MASTRFPHGLYGVTPDWPDTDRLLEAIRKARAGGMAVVQWRRKQGSPGSQRHQARQVRDLCQQLGLPLIINDHWQLALELDAQGVHLGRDDADPARVREALGPDRLLGVSCYNEPDRAARLLQYDVDYIAFGALYPSSIKPGAVHATLAHVQQGRQLAQARPAPRPAVVAIGGLTPENAGPVLEAGADSLAVISALFDASDVQRAAERFLALLNPLPDSSP